MKKLFVFLFSVMFFCWAYAQSPVQLSVQMHGGSESICSGEFQIRIDVSNASNNDATNVKCKLNLPSYVSIVNQADTMILFDLVEAGDNIFYVVSLRNSGSFGVATSIPLMCQIWDCDQPDAESLAYGQWDWTGSPNRLGARVDVPVMNTASSSDIQITSAEVCYGGTAVLKAKAPNLSYPQNFVWYSSDLHTVLLQEEITEVGGESQLPIPSCTKDETYYVTVADDDHCPVILLYNYSTLSLNGNTSGQTSNMAHDDCIYFYDEGGKTGSYPASNATLVHTFKAELENDNLYFSLKSLSLGGGDVLNIYDGTSVDDAPLASLTANSAAQNFQSTGRALTIEFVQGNTSGTGWEAEIAAKQYAKQVSTVLLNPQQDGQMTTVSPLDSILFYDEGGETGAYALNSDLSCTFTSMMGNVRADFTGIGANLRVGDSLIVYDGSSTDAPILHFFVSSSPRYPVLTSTGQSLTFRLVTRASQPGAGWRAQITSVNPESSMAKATVSIKAPSNMSSLIQTTDVEACYGSEATLTASSDIQGPQTFVWYSPDRMSIVKEETIYGGESEYAVMATEEETYYVAVTNAENCPIVEQAHPNYREVLMTGSDSYSLSATDSIGFFDAGGKDGDYEANQGDRYVRFNAPSGSHIRLHFNMLNIVESGDAELSFYDGREYVNLRGSKEDLDYVIEQDYVDIYFYNWSSETAEGWDAYVYAIMPHDISELAEVTVRLKSLPLNTLSTTDAEVCYGSEATLTASSDIQGPQTFVWYSPDRMSVVKKETIQSGSSTLTVTPNTEETYYVTVTNDDNCPIIEGVHHNYREVMMTERSRTITIASADSIAFFDEGGRDGNYGDGDHWYYFNAPAGSNIKLHFNSIVLGEVQMEIRDRNNRIAYLRNINDGDLDYVIEGDYLQIYFNNSSSETAEGWDAYVYAIMPHNNAELKSARVTFSNPDISNTVQTAANVEACYGETVTLTATNGGGTSRFAWYDKELNLLKDETGENSTLEVIAIPDAKYYVNASAENECPILNPRYGQLWFDASMDGDITHLTEGVAIPFYDAGGPDANYNTPGANWTHTFIAPEGKQVTLQMKSFYTNCGHTLAIFDGEENNHYQSWWYHCGHGDLNETITSSMGQLTVRWSIDYNGDYYGYPGWDALVGVLDANDEMHVNEVELAHANISIKSNQPSVINAPDVEACYGSDVTLTATAAIDYPQTFVWYSPDRFSILHQETIDAGASSFTITPTVDETYYVAVTNECPIVESVHTNYREVRMDGRQSEYTLSATDSIGFFDMGGKDGDYTGTGAYTYYFYAPEGAHIKLHLNNIEIGNDTYMWIYDRNHHIATIDNSYSDVDYLIEDDYIYIQCQKNDPQSSSGWEGYIYAVMPHDTSTLKPVKVSFNPVISNTVQTADVEACIGEMVTLTATNGGGTSRFAWFDEDLNLLKDETGENSTLEVTATSNAKYYVNASAENECPVLTPHNGQLWFDASMDGGATNLTEGVAIPFYDAGGPNANYNTPEANWTHTFIAPEGKQVTLQLKSFFANYGHILSIYDGNENSYYNSWYYEGNRGDLNENITSSRGRLTVRWYINYNENNFNYPGWEALVGVLDVNDEMHVNEVELAYANVSIKSTMLSAITTTDAEVCYGSEATLTASAAIGYPQTFVWYSPDRFSVVKRETITSGVSEYSFVAAEEETYYVAVTNEDGCPIVDGFHPDYKEILYGSTSSYTLSATDSIGFFDEGGKEGMYNPCSSTAGSISFNAPEGSYIRLHFTKVDLRYSDYYIEDRNHTIAHLRGVAEDVDYIIEDNYLHLYRSSSSCGYDDVGWEGYIYAIMPHDESTLAQANVSLKTDAASAPITTSCTEICYGSEGTLTASSTIGYPQYYTWYSPDRWTVLKRDTVLAGNSTLTIQPATAESYYVAVSNNSTCPIVESVHPNYREVLMNGGQSSYTLSLKDSIGFFDNGGKNGNHGRTTNGSYEYYFSVPQGAHIRVHFDTVALASSRAELYIKDRNGNRYYAYMEGPYHAANLDYVIPANEIRIYFYNSDSRTDLGWEGYIYAFMPQDENLLTETPVHFKSPDISNIAQISDVEACYGEHVTLTASAEMAYPQYYAWYDSELNLLKQELITSGNSSIEVQVAENTSYYVNVTGENGCPILPFGGGPLLLNEQTTNQMTTLPAGTSISFYDDGGANGSYSNNADYWNHVFVAEEGHQVTLQISSFESGDCSDFMLIYDIVDLENFDMTLLDQLCGSRNNETYTSTNGMLAVVFYSDGSSVRDGWSATVKVSGTGMSVANITMKQREAAEVTTTDALVCYGSEATLTASADIAYPQTFVWYSPNRITVLKEETIQNGVSTLTLTPDQEGTYYVAVTNANNCPIVETVHNNYQEFLLHQNGGSSGTINIAYNDSLRFYDAGGPTGDYVYGWSSEHYIKAPAGSYIRLHMDTIALTNNDAYLQIRDNNNRTLKNLSGSLHSSNLDYVFPTNQIRLYFNNSSSYTDMGWEGYIYAVNPHDMAELTAANVSFQEPDITTWAQTSDVEACYGTSVTLEATAEISYPQHYAWYDSELNLLNHEIITAGNSSLDVFVTDNTNYYVNVSGENGCPVLPPGYGQTTIWLNESNSGRTTTVKEGHPIEFYDDGGPEDQYSNNANYWYYLFKGDEGRQVTLQITSFKSESGYDKMEVYDVINMETLDVIPLAEIEGDKSNVSYTSEHGILGIVWHSDGSVTKDGWSAIVKLEGDESGAGGQIDMSVANVSVEQSQAIEITTNEVEVCYGSEATLSASCSTLDYPQYYTWYSPDRLTVLKRDTITAGASTLTLTPTVSESYYVAVANNTTCPIVEPLHSNYREVIMTMEGDADFRIGNNDSIAIFDGGGKDGNYQGQFEMEAMYHFRPTNSEMAIRLHIDTISLGQSGVMFISCGNEVCPVSDIIGGEATNLDYMFEPPYNEVYIGVQSMEELSVDWSGYIYVVQSQRDEILTEVPVRFKNPSISHNIQVENVEACYGEEVVLSASVTDVAYPQHFAWYDNNMRLIKQDILTEGSGSLTVTAWDDATYYVNVSAENECPILSPDFGVVAINESTNFQVSQVSEGNPLLFSDNGYADRNIRGSENIWIHTFVPDVEGQQITLSLLSYMDLDGSGRLYVVDGMEPTEEYMMAEIRGMSAATTFTSTRGALMVGFFSESQQIVDAKWESVVSIAGDDSPIGNMTPIQLSLKRTTYDASLVTSNDTVCYGGDAVLTASSSLSGTQYYEWRTEDYATILKRDTVTDGISSLIVPEQMDTASYYVNVHNGESCPVVKYTTGREFAVYLNEENNNQTTFLNKGDRAHFYDDGGPDGDYSPYINCKHTFEVGENYYICARFNAVAELAAEGSAFIINQYGVTQFIGGDQWDDLTPGFQPILMQNNLTLGLINIDGQTAAGFNFDLYPIPVFSENNTILMDAEHHNDTTIVRRDEMCYLLDDGGLMGDYSTSAYDYRHSFTAEQGKLSVSFLGGVDQEYNVELAEEDTLYVYDSDNSLIASYAGNTNDNPDIQSSGKTITIRFVTHGYNRYEGGFIALVQSVCDTTELVKASVYLKQGGEGVDEMSICRRELPITLGSTTLEDTISSGIYEVVYPQASANGCDSIVALNVTVLENTTYTETKYIYGLPYTWYDTTFLSGTQSGTYEYHLDNQAGCDSAMILNLIVMCEPIVLSDTVDKVICAASVTLGNQTYTANGQYDITYYNILGCDSMVTTNLVLNHPDNPAYVFTLSCPSSVYDTIRANECSVAPQLGMPTFEHHALAVIPSYVDSITITNNAPAEFPKGETVVLWTAVDNCGNTATCEQHVYIAMEDCPLAVDYEGNEYQTVRLGDDCLCWMAENLRSTQYSDGRPIDNVMSYSSELFPNEAANVSIYGHLYDWYAAADTATNSIDSVERAYALGKRIHGICPEGWYLPTDEDIDGLNVYPTADLRSTDYWLKGGGTNSTGFNAVPGGMYNCSTDRYEDLTAFSFYWSCHPVIDKATGGLIDYVCEKILMQDIPHCSGLSVRCVNKEQ